MAMLLASSFISTHHNEVKANIGYNYSVSASSIGRGSFDATFTISDSAITNDSCNATVSGINAISGSVSNCSAVSGTMTITTNLTYLGGSEKGSLQLNASQLNNQYSHNFTIYETIPDDTKQPEPDVPDVPNKPFGNIFSVKTGTKIPEIAAGSSLDLKIPLVKNGSINNSLAQITTTLPDGLYFYEIGNVQDMKFKTGKSAENDLILKISANSDAKSGVYPIEMTIKYKYDGGNTEEKLTYYVKVLGSGGASGHRLQVSGYSFDKQSIQSGDTFDLKIDVKNPTNTDLKNVRVSLGGLSAEGILINNSLDSIYLPVLKANSTTAVHFPLIASSNITSNNHMLELSLSADGMDAPIVSKIFAFISKGSESQSSNSKPKIVIDNYDFGNESVVGGKPFTLNFSIRNTSGGTEIKNLKVTILSVSDEQTGGAFTPTSSSNSFFIKSLNANSSTNQSIELLPKADAKPKSYGLEIKFEYEAFYKGELTEMTSTEMISIPLTQSDVFEVSDIESYGPLYVGMETQLNVPYVNKGKSTINNLEIKVEGENLTLSENGSYVGNVESGSSDSYSLNITPKKVGPISGKIIFTYQDANGKMVEVMKEFKFEAMDMVQPDNPDIMVPNIDEGSTFPLWAKVLIGVIVLGGVCGVGYVVYQKVKIVKVKKVEDAYDDYDDFPEDGESSL